MTVIVPISSNMPVAWFIDHRSVLVPGGRWSAFGNVIGAGRLKRIPAGCTVIKKAGRIEGGRVEGARSTGTGSILSWWGTSVGHSIVSPSAVRTTPGRSGLVT